MPFVKDCSLEVYQNEIIVTTASAMKSVLGTLGLEPCIALVLICNDQVALAHLDGSPMRRTLRRVIAYMREQGAQHAMTGQVLGSSAGLVGHRVRVEDLLRGLDVTLLPHQVHDTPSPDDSETTPNLNLAVKASGGIELDIRFAQLDKRTNAHKHEPNPKLYAVAVRRGPLAWSLVKGSRCTWNGDHFDSMIVTTGNAAGVDIEDQDVVIEYASELKMVEAAGYRKRTFAMEQAEIARGVKPARRTQITYSE